MHVEEYITTAITVPLNDSFLRLWHVQVIVRQPGLLLHVIHVTDVMTLCTEKWRKFKYKRLRKFKCQQQHQGWDKILIQGWTFCLYTRKYRGKTAAHLSDLNLLKEGGYDWVTPEYFYSWDWVKAHQRKSCLQCDWRHWWVWKSWPDLHSVNKVCHQVTKDKTTI